MKKLILLAMVALQGCALIDAYNMAKFDNNEYGLVANIRTQTENLQQRCKDTPYIKSTLVGIYVSTKELQNYTEHLPNNKEAFKLSSDLVALTKSTVDFYSDKDTVSEVFCKAKLQQITTSANTIQKVIGNKPR